MATDNTSKRICFCNAVSEAEIEKAIMDGARTLAEIQAKTKASTSCGGCEPDVKAILERVLARTAAAPKIPASKIK